MPGLWKTLGLASALCSSLFTSVAAFPDTDLVARQTTSSNSSATYIYTDGTDGGNFTFTITINPADNDMWFRMSAPAQYSWISVGAGTKMATSKVMFMAYEGSADNSLTISARGPCDQCEPSFMKDFGLNSAIPPSNDKNPYGINNGIYSVTGFVANGTVRAGIDPKSKGQPFIFAVGPENHAPRSNSFTAPLRQHVLHGNFLLDMTSAYGIKLPALGTAEAGVKLQGSTTLDHERSSPAHALILIFAFLVIFPLGVLMLRLLNKVNLHMYVQTVGMLFVVIGTIMGFIMSKTYNRSKSYNSAHQVIGIVVFVLLIVQFVFGVLHHRTYMRTQQPTFMIKPHKWVLGPLSMGLGLVNAALGFRFAISGSFNVIYVPLIIAMLILVMIAVTLKRFMVGRRKKSEPFGGPAPPAYGQQGAPSFASQAAPPVYGNAQTSKVGPAPTLAEWNPQRSDIELGKMGPPPGYDTQPAQPREMI